MARGANGTSTQQSNFSGQQSSSSTRQAAHQFLQRSVIFVNPRFLESGTQAFTATDADVDFVVDSGCSTHMVPSHI